MWESTNWLIITFLFHRYKYTIKLSSDSLYTLREATGIYKENGSQCRAREEYDPRTAGEHISIKNNNLMSLRWQRDLLRGSFHSVYKDESQVVHFKLI